MKKIMATLLSILFCVGATLPVAAAESAPHFVDVPTSHWAYSSVEQAYADGVITGTSWDPIRHTGVFSPDKPLTNAEFATILARGFLMGNLVVGADQPWYMPYISALQEYGLLTGTTVAERPNSIASRYDMAVIMTALLRYKQATMPNEAQMRNAANSIGDWAQIPARYQDAVATVYALGLISGVNAHGDFAGNSSVTRSTICKVYCSLANVIDPGKPVSNPHYSGTSLLTYTSVVGKPLKRDGERTENGASYIYECDVNGSGLQEAVKYTDYLIAEQFSLLAETADDTQVGYVFGKIVPGADTIGVSVVIHLDTNEVTIIVVNV